MARTNKTTMRKAVNSVFALVREGHSITTARKTIAKELGIVANTLWSWQDRLHMTTPVITNKITKVSNKTVVSRQGNIDSGINNLNNQLGHVFTSLVRKDGTYTTKEASAISQVSNNILGLAKYELEVHKYADRTAKRSVVKSLL